MSNVSRVAAGLWAGAIALIVLAGCTQSAATSGGDIASVNGEKISRAQLDSKLEGSPTARQVLNSLVQTLLVDQYAKDNHVDVSDADVQKKEDDIKSKYPAGQFDMLLKQQNLTEDDVKKILRQQAGAARRPSIRTSRSPTSKSRITSTRTTRRSTNPSKSVRATSSSPTRKRPT